MSSSVPAWIFYDETVPTQGHSDPLVTKQSWKKSKTDPLYI